MAQTRNELSKGNGIAFLIGTGLLIILILLWLFL